MILSMQNEYFNRLSLEQALKKVRAFGLRHVECTVLWFRDMDLGRARELLARYQVKLSAINTWFNDQTPAEKQAYILEGLRMARALKAGFVIVYFGNLAQVPTIKLFKKVIAPCLAEAEKSNITLALETEFDPTGKDLTRSADGTLQILEAVNSPRLKLNFDMGNTYIAGEEAYPYAYQKLKEHIGYIHLKDAVKYDPERHGPEKKNLIFKDLSGRSICVPFGRGAINFEGLLGSIRASNYRGFLTIEPHVPHAQLEETYRADIAYVKAKLNV